MDKCSAKNLLIKNSLKLTNQRELLLKTIIDSDSIFSAISLQEKVNDSMDMATIYRILTVFLKKNIIREVITNDNTCFYELSCEHHPVHPHFFCKKCKSITCLNPINAHSIIANGDYSSDYIIEDIAIQLMGICPKCK